MPNPGSSEVGQRRFWNALADQPGVIYIGAWPSGLGDGCDLWAAFNQKFDFYGNLLPPSYWEWEHVYNGVDLESGVLPFPTRFKTARYWSLTYGGGCGSMGSVDWDGTNEWIFKPYSTDMGLVGPNAWMRGADWDTANLFYDSSPFKLQRDGATSLHYWAKLEAGNVEGGYFEPYATGWGPAGLMYGYLNDHYFGNNEMGGDKPSEGGSPQKEAIGDLSKTYVGLWGAFGIAHGIAPGGYACFGRWTFDLCDRAALAATTASLSLGNQTEGWGTDVVKVTTSEGRRQFILDVTPARGTLNVYTPQGERLFEGVHYIPQDCDRSGRYYWLLYEPTDPCNKVYHLVVTYLVLAATLRQGKRTSRLIDTNEGHDRLRNLDIRGFG